MSAGFNSDANISSLLSVCYPNTNIIQRLSAQSDSHQATFKVLFEFGKTDHNKQNTLQALLGKTKTKGFMGFEYFKQLQPI